MVLLLSNQKDLHVDPVVSHLRRLGRRFVRVNTDDLPTSWRIVCHDDSDGYSDFFTNGCNEKSFSWSDVTAVWYRRPNLPENLPTEISERNKKFVASELYSLLQYQLSALNPAETIWVSNPHSLARANSRFLQTRAARDAGFKIPSTLITNQPDAVRTFVQQCDRPSYAVKRISSHSQVEGDVSFFTIRLTREALLKKAEQVALCPTLIQEYIPKACEYRVTVIGSKVFTCRLYSQNDSASTVDWRTRDPSLIRHEMVSLPRLETKTLCAVNALGLRFGAVDLIETPDGEIVFVEINPNGQWYWIEQITGAGMSEAMAELLSTSAR